MTPREAFKLGFLQKCAADGLTDDDILERIHNAKALSGDPELLKQATITWKMLKPILQTVGAGLATGGVLGVAGGGLLANATNTDYDVNEAKKREELAEYQHALQAMKQLHERQEMGVA